MTLSRTAALVCGLIAALLLSTTELAGAKMPPFDVDVSPQTVHVGDELTVRVTIKDWRNTDEVDTGFQAPRLDGVLGVHPVSGLTAQGRPAPGTGRALPVRLKLARPGVYRGSVVLTEPGDYAVVAFPDVRDTLPGYPAASRVSVEPLPMTGSGTHCATRR